MSLSSDNEQLFANLRRLIGDVRRGVVLEVKAELTLHPDGDNGDFTLYNKG